MKYRIPYLEASAEYTKKIGVLPFGFGGFFGFSGYGGDQKMQGLNVKAERNYLNFGALVNYHVQLPVEKLDVYTGIRSGVQFRHTEIKLDGENSTTAVNITGTETKGSFYFDYKLGATYYFTNLIGVNVETGFPTYLKASVSFKF